MTGFDLEAMRSRNRIEGGVPFLAIVRGDELLLDAGLLDVRLVDELDRFTDEGSYENNLEGMSE